MASWILSVLLYLATILLGFYIDSQPVVRYQKWRKAYVIWLYVFLCFGYMTGSDWRNYEDTYTTGAGLIRFISEPGSYFLFSAIPKILPDFWVFLGLMKCLYLYSTQRLVKLVTPRWISVMALLVSENFDFMLVQNPFRYMVAVTVINFALYFLFSYYSVEQKHKVFTVFFYFVLIVTSILFHNSCVLFLALMPLLFLSPLISRTNRCWLFVIYILVTFLTSNLSFINSLKESAILLVQRYIGISDYASYESDDNSAVFSIGNILRIITFLVVLYSRDIIIKSHKCGWLVYSITVVYYFISRILILVPTGFRIAIPFGLFSSIYVVLLLYSSRRTLATLLILYSLTAFTRDLWTHYDFIPYSNSIPYIICGHKSYNDRYWNNLNEYARRTGEEYEIKTD